MRHRYDPGLGVWAFGEVRGYEGLIGAASGIGINVGYSWDLVDLHAGVIQNVTVVGEGRPTNITAGLDFALFTIGGFSTMLLVNGDYMLSPPMHQAGVGSNSMIGTGIGLGVRYRIGPLVDVFVDGTGEVLRGMPVGAQFFLEPGVSGGVVFHPFGSEDSR
jgi:hypothetical protein